MGIHRPLGWGTKFEQPAHMSQKKSGRDYPSRSRLMTFDSLTVFLPKTLSAGAIATDGGVFGGPWLQSAGYAHG